MQCILYKIYFWEGFSYVLQINMHLICAPMLTKFYSCKKWVLHASTSIHNCFNYLINGLNITFIHGPGASRPGTMRQRNMNSNFVQRFGGRLYDTVKMGQQEYGAEFILNGSKPSVANPK
jgi:hypothetical protein